jgi:hypothetical protein
MSSLTSLTHGNATLQANPDTLCTLSTCDLSLAHFTYLPSLGGNALYAVIFGLFIVGQLYLGIKHRTWGFMTAMSSGLVLEIIGYIARIMMNSNPFNKNSFLLYLICLTIAPALISAAVYLCLARIVVVYGEGASRFRPATYTLLFCGCDFFSLLLQAVGGAIASGATTQSSTQLGINIMLAGLSVQVASLALFACLCGEFALRLYQNPQSWGPKHETLYSSKLFKAFLVGLSVATLTIFIRSTFRVAELSGGFKGPLANNEISFMILEGCIIIIACGCLTFLHPGIAFQGAWHEANFTFRQSARDDVEKRLDTPDLETPPEYADIGGPEYVISRQSTRIAVPEHTVSRDSRI